MSAPDEMTVGDILEIASAMDGIAEALEIDGMAESADTIQKALSAAAESRSMVEAFAIALHKLKTARLMLGRKLCVVGRGKR